MNIGRSADPEVEGEIPGILIFLDELLIEHLDVVVLALHPQQSVLQVLDLSLLLGQLGQHF